jgi:hypothetical protein
LIKNTSGGWVVKTFPGPLKMKTAFSILIFFLLGSGKIFCQNNLPDSKTIVPADTVSKSALKKDTAKKKEFIPRVAAIRSAILPGLGQIYNKKYWKLPIVYGVMGISGGVFLFNLKQYKDTRFAYSVKYNMRVFKTDSAKYDKIRDDLKPLSEESLRFYRNQYRRDIDYSAIVFILMWGLNVVDATVDAHLKSFDVTPDLSLKIKPGYSDFAKTNGLSLILRLGK